jgi:HKD family nuclease
MPLGFNETSTNILTTIKIPSCTNNTSRQFFVQCKQDAHILLYMDISNLVFVQIKFKILTSRYLYIHSFPMPMSYIDIY